MFGPTLLEYGTEAQKAQHIPPIARGELRWCQGYSEPGAGSDLASLQTRCEDKGDHWLVNGQKIWTSGAQYADWCYCLVRTDPKAKKHEGISFLMIDMHAPGVEVRPILLINGTSPFCETFFTDVKVPKENQWGPLNGGWTVGKRLLQFERDSISAGLGGGNIGAAAATMTVDGYARKYIGLDDDGRLADPDYRRRLIDHRMENQAFQLTVRRAADEAKSNQGPSAASSIMKYAGAKIAQERTELIVEAMGAGGARLGGRRLRARGAGERPRLAALEGQLDRGRLVGDQPQRRVQACARIARSRRPTRGPAFAPASPEILNVGDISNGRFWRRHRP